MDKKKIYINCYSRTERDRVTLPMAEGGHSHFIGFKGMRSDMSCRGYQYKLGENRITKEIDRDAIYSDNGLYFKVPSGFISLCNRGLHFCWELGAVFYYYPFYAEVPEEFGNRYCIVMTNGQIESKIEKACTDSLIVLEEIPRHMVKEYSNIRKEVMLESAYTEAHTVAMHKSGIHELVQSTVDNFINFNSRSFNYEVIIS